MCSLIAVFVFTHSEFVFIHRRVCDVDMLSVSETATEPPQDEGNSINAPRNLAMEAKFINQNFSQQVLKMVSAFEVLFRKKSTSVMPLSALM